MALDEQCGQDLSSRLRSSHDGSLLRLCNSTTYVREITVRRADVLRLIPVDAWHPRADRAIAQFVFA